MDLYSEVAAFLPPCRFAVGGPGSCLRKYSDPTFFRKELSNPSKTDDIKVQRDQAHRKRKVCNYLFFFGLGYTKSFFSGYELFSSSYNCTSYQNGLVKNRVT